DLKAQWAKEELARINAQNDLSQSLLNLAQLLNVSNAESFDILEPEYLSSMDIALIQNPDAVYESALALKPVIKEADFRYRSSEVGIKMAKSYFLPTVNLGFSYNNGFNYLFGSGVNNISLSSQISNNQREAISLNISIPIFNRFQTRNQVRSAQLNRNNRALELDNAKINLQKEIQQAYRSALAAQARYYATETACQSSLEAFKYAEERYQLQMISAYEYSEAQTKLFSSRSEQVQAKYDFLFRVKILDFYSGVEIAL
ncbi:MAG: TolC family protein, partial [Bacteroidetes bacterium]|nr:TolC family protein [Bacteroidota bacterium]